MARTATSCTRAAMGGDDENRREFVPFSRVELASGQVSVPAAAAGEIASGIVPRRDERRYCLTGYRVCGIVFSRHSA
jgi:hypothetical protein